METITYSVTGVKDTVTENKISVDEAVEMGILNQEKGLYIDPKTGEQWSISDAIDAGLVLVELSSRKFTRGDVVDGAGHPLDSGAHYVDKNFIIHGVTDPVSQYEISYAQAVKDGILDKENGLYCDPKTGKTINIAEAMRRGLVKTRAADYGHEDDEKMVTVKVLQVVKKSILDPDRSLEKKKLMSSVSTEPATDSQASYNKLKQSVDVKTTGIKDPKTGKDLTLEEAMERGLLNLDTMEYRLPSGETISLQQAAARGLLDMTAFNEIMNAYNENSLDSLIRNGYLNPETGKYVDPKTGKSKSLIDAIREGKIDPNEVFLMNMEDLSVRSLQNADKEDIFNLRTGCIVDPNSGEEISIAEALDRGIIRANLDPRRITEQVSALRALNKHMDITMKGIKCASTGEDNSIEQAVLTGLYDVPHSEYVNASTHEGEYLPLAAKGDNVETETALEIITAMGELSLGNAIKEGFIDPDTGKYVNVASKRRMTIGKAKDNFFMDPNTVFFVDNTPEDEPRLTSLGQSAEEGKFNTITGRFIDPETKKELSINAAIKKGIVEPAIVPKKFVQVAVPLKDLLESGMAADAMFVAPDGTVMPLKDAIAAGYVTKTTKVKVDPETGHVMLLGGGDMVGALMEIKKHLDWVGDIEKLLGGQSTPSQEVEGIKKQLEDHKVITTK